MKRRQPTRMDGSFQRSSASLTDLLLPNATRKKGDEWSQPDKRFPCSRSLTAQQPFLQWFTNYERAITKRFRSGLSLGSIDRSLSNRRRSQRRWPWAQYLGHFLPTAGQSIERR